MIKRFYSFLNEDNPFDKYVDGNKIWLMDDIIPLTRDLPIFDYPITEELLEEKLFWKLNNTRDFLAHFKRVSEANLQDPIILNAEGEIMDGRHRIMKAFIEGRKSVKAVQFEKTPPPSL